MSALIAFNGLTFESHHPIIGGWDEMFAVSEVPDTEVPTILNGAVFRTSITEGERTELIRM
jgi:hypothetical protein